MRKITTTHARCDCHCRRPMRSSIERRRPLITIDPNHIALLQVLLHTLIGKAASTLRMPNRSCISASLLSTDIVKGLVDTWPQLLLRRKQQAPRSQTLTLRRLICSRFGPGLLRLRNTMRSVFRVALRNVRSVGGGARVTVCFP